MHSLHLIADAGMIPLPEVSTPANVDVREQVPTLIDRIETKTVRVGRPAKKMSGIAGDKGYDSEELRKNLGSRGVQPQIPRKRNAKGAARKTCHDDRAKSSS